MIGEKKIFFGPQSWVTRMVVSVPGQISAMYLRVLGLLLCFAASAFGQGAGSEYPMRRVADIFQPLSRPAEMIHVTAVLVLIISAVIFVIVTGLLIYIVVKFRRPEDDDGTEPPQIYGSTNIELAWTVIPILITVVLILVTSRTIGEIQDMKMPANAVKVRVVGHQWWWEVHYPDLGIITANEIHVPISDRDPAKATPTAFDPPVRRCHAQLLGAATCRQDGPHPQQGQ